MRHARAILIAPLLVILAASATLADDRDDDQGEGRRPFTYAIIGDSPYGTAQVGVFPSQLAEISADTDVRLLVHVGDIKSGSSACSDAYLAARAADFGTVSVPVVYTPGDNEWTDCHRTGFNPVERLEKIRELFFPVRGRTLGADARRVRAQRGDTLENVSWRQGRVQFATLHVVGSNNSWLPWTGLGQTGLDDQTPEQIAEAQTRDDANLAWLERVFDEAEDARAVVLFMQADLWDPAFAGPTYQDPLNVAQYDRYTRFVQKLAREARAFRKPVLLINGDSHVYTDDRPLSTGAAGYQRDMYGITRPVENLRRITVNGSDTPCQEYLKLDVDASTRSVFDTQRVQLADQVIGACVAS